MTQLPGFEVGPAAWKDSELVAYRGTSRADATPVLIKTTVRAVRDLAHAADVIRRECTLIRTLPPEHFPHPLACIDHDGRTWAVFPWLDASPLADRMRAAPPSMDESLAIAGAAALLLDHLHARRAVHGRLCPGSLLWCPGSAQVQLWDLGTSAAAEPGQGDHQRPLSASQQGYAAPERVCAPGPSVDYRADLFALGAMLYELLTGRPPFPDAASGPLDRLGRASPPPTPDRSQVPAQLWAILRRCLDPAPERRYCSGAGLHSDLARCRAQLRENGQCDPFELATQDVPTQLLLSEKLYGREAQLEALTQRYREAQEGSARFVLIHGAPGIGKTSLVNAFGRGIGPDGGTFVTGKHAQYQTDQPYVGVTEALRSLVSPVLSSSPQDLEHWRRRLDEALGENAAVIGSVLPELGFPPPLPLPPRESRNRFLSTFVSFLRHFIRDRPPLVLFLDDLQWMDRATQELLAELLTAPGIDQLLVIGTYRDNEVREDSGLARLLDRREALGITDIELTPLTADAVGRFLLDSLHCPADRVHGLARVVRDKTRSNPFFMTRFIEGLYADGYIRYRPGSRRWTWDEDEIANVAITENVVDLMVEKLKGYAPPVVDALAHIACLGGGVPLWRLSLLLGTTHEEIQRRLQPAMADGVLIRELDDRAPDAAPGENVALATATAVSVATARQPTAQHEVSRTRLRFSHDKVEEAAYALLEPHARERLHLRIGRHLLAHDLARGDDIFLVTSQFDRWLARHALPEEDDAVADLYVQAGQRAKANNAYSSARQCFHSADRLLDEGCWDTKYRLMIGLYREWAETEYLLGNLDRSRALINKALQHCERSADEARLIVLLIDQHTANAEYQEALILGRNALAELGFEAIMGRPFPKRRFAKVLDEELGQAAGYPVQAFEGMLMQAGEPDDPRLGAIMMVLMSLIPPSYFVDRKLNALVATFMARLTFEKAFVCESTAKGIGNFGNALAEERGMYREGYLFARLARRFAEERYPAVVPRILYVLAGSMNHWVQHLARSEEDIEAGIRQCEKYGERDYNGYLRTLARCQNGIYLGRPLAEFKQAVNESIAFVERSRNALGLQVARTVHRAICELDGSGPWPREPDHTGAAGAGGTLEQEAEDPDTTLVRCIAAVLRAQNAYLLGLAGEARSAIETALAAAHSLSTEMTLPMLNLFSSLVDLEALREPGVTPEALRQIVRRVRANQQRMHEWADGCPENFRHTYLLVEGLLAESEGRALDAIKLLKAAAEAAASAGYRQFEGLAHELLARVWQTEDQAAYALGHRKAAAAAYAAWGARRVVDRLVGEHPDAAAYGAPASADHVQRTIAAPAGRRDAGLYREVLAPWVHALAGDAMTGALREVPVRQIARLAGARRCLLFAPAGEELKVIAAYPAAGREEEPPADEDVLRVVRRASRTGRAEGVAAGQDAPAAGGGRGVLAVPAFAGGGLVAVAYLENREGVLDVDEERLGLLRVLLLLGNLDRNSREHTDVRSKLGKAARFLPAHVLDAVLARRDDRAPAIFRQEVAIAFFDLRRFTAFHSSVEPEEGRRLLVEYRRAAGEIIERYGATVDHWEGDGCMVFIAAPVPQGERIERLVDMAVDMRDRARELIAGWKADGYRLGFGVGAAYGYADCGILGCEGRWDYSATGRYVSLASRLCDEAQDGQILVPDRVHSIVAHARHAELLGEREIDGFADAVRIFNILD